MLKEITSSKCIEQSSDILYWSCVLIHNSLINIYENTESMLQNKIPRMTVAYSYFTFDYVILTFSHNFL